jgi:hypothetical protein
MIKTIDNGGKILHARLRYLLIKCKLRRDLTRGLIIPSKAETFFNLIAFYALQSF